MIVVERIVMMNKEMRYTILTLILAASLGIHAEGIISGIDSVATPARPNLLDSLYDVEIIQDSAVARLLETAMNGRMEWVEMDGYRVQIYSSNQQQTAKAEALNLETNLKDKIQQTVYVLYLTPFWKVRLGDFRTYEEAKEYKKLFVQQYPEMMGDTYIVRDKIQVLQ